MVKKLSDISTENMPSLLISPAAQPFPYAALVTASYLDIPIIFEESKSSLVLKDGPSASNELEIVSVLTTSTQAHADDPKVIDYRQPRSIAI